VGQVLDDHVQGLSASDPALQFAVKQTADLLQRLGAAGSLLMG
jgi:hypothetical protein